MKATAHEFLKIQLDFNNSVISKNISGIIHEESMVFPNGEVNCMNWVFGHLIFVRNTMIQILGGEKVWNDDEFSFYARGEKPLLHQEKFPDFETLKSYFKDTENELNHVLAKTENIKAENLEDLAALMLHEIYHSGQIGYLRRILGKEGTIK
ncbi:hypothetical protein MTP09_06705 [Chryseobacterium suipulveris]|uniref:DinB family protein n=1 Tax=Chryseobacterium suipulveris TaxID=2929800 RepID=A0ABY4BSZ8_9FLAO|nr:DinB family protein [Chryseobacterium suipulveris]UOE42320.1 hypothetical protein MTP09_06705 [Chryseobacterium suipulveris]